MNELIERFKSESPVFFKKLKKYALSIGGSATAVLIVNASMNLNLDQTLIAVLGFVVAACAAIAGTSQLTRQ
jgi:hypothetical protein